MSLVVWPAVKSLFAWLEIPSVLTQASSHGIFHCKLPSRRLPLPGEAQVWVEVPEAGVGKNLKI